MQVWDVFVSLGYLRKIPLYVIQHDSLLVILCFLVKILCNAYVSFLDGMMIGMLWEVYDTLQLKQPCHKFVVADPCISVTSRSF